MKIFLWVLLSISLLCLQLWIVAGPWIPENRSVIFLIVVFFGASGLGGFWMLYMAVRYESHPWPFVALALLPYTFLWYYFERVRAGKHRTRILVTE
jgi:drug/metabolite transporter (DMT)-like permease